MGIQFTTISINVERGIVKILFRYRYRYFSNTSYRYRYRYRYFPKSPYRYRYFLNCLIDIDIDIDIFKYDHIDIDIFQKCRYIDNRYVILIYRTGLIGGNRGILDAPNISKMKKSV